MTAENIKKMSLKDFVNLAIGVPFLDHGRDFQGWDCWGLVVLAYRECFGIVIEDFSGLTGLNSTESEKLYESHRTSWVEIENGKEIPGDLIIMRTRVIHVGVVVKKNMMIHAQNDYGTSVESYAAAIWKSRILGIYRHKDRHAELAG